MNNTSTLLNALTRRPQALKFLTPGFAGGTFPALGGDDSSPAGNNSLPSFGNTRPLPAPSPMAGGNDGGSPTTAVTAANGAPNTAPATRPRYVDAVRPRIAAETPEAAQGGVAPVTGGTTATAATRPRQVPVRPNDPIQAAWQAALEKDKEDRAANHGVKNVLKRIAKNAGAGFLHGAASGNIGEGLGGAAVGAILSETKPEWAARLRFNTLERPKLQRDETEQYERTQRMNNVLLDQAKIQTETRRSENIGSQIESRGQEDKNRAAYNEAQVRLAQAREEATRRGVPKQTDIVNQAGEVVRVNVWPDGKTEIIGKSPQPVIEAQRGAVRERIATTRNATSRGNNAATNATRERIAAQRLQARPARKSANAKRFPAGDVKALAESWGVDENEAKRRLQISGWEVK